jgi:hypothetical protein
MAYRSLANKFESSVSFVNDYSVAAHSFAAGFIRALRMDRWKFLNKLIKSLNLIDYMTNGEMKIPVYIMFAYNIN